MENNSILNNNPNDYVDDWRKLNPVVEETGDYIITRTPVYGGILYDGEDVYNAIRNGIGLDVRNDNNYYIGYGGAMDVLGGETFFTTYALYKITKKRKNHKRIIIPPFNPELDGDDEFDLNHGNGIRDLNNSELGNDGLGSNNVRTNDFNNSNLDDKNLEITDKNRNKGHNGNDNNTTQNKTGERDEPQDPSLNNNTGINLSDPGSSSNLENVHENDEIDNKKNIFKVVKRIKNRLTPILAASTLAFSVLSAIEFIDVVTNVIESKTVIEEVEKNNLDYEYIREMTFGEIISDIDMGEFLFLKDGTPVYVDSEKTGIEYHIGGDNFLRNEGDYRVTGFAIVVNGQYVDFVTDLDGENKVVNLGKFVDDYCKAHNLSIDDVDVMLHFGSNYDYTRAGWVDINDVLEQVIAKRATQYTGTIDNISDSATYITLTNGVRLPIKDSSGNYYKPGDIVVGSDSNEYKIEQLSIEKDSYTKENVQYIEKEVITGKKLNFSVTNISLLELGAIAALAAATAASIISTRKKNKELAQTPFFDEAESYDEILKTAEEAKEAYKKLSKFEKLKRFFFKKKDVVRTLTPEQEKQVYEIIKRIDTETYKYEYTDTILPPRNGRFIVLKDNGEEIDVTRIVLNDLVGLAAKNPVVANGELKDEKEAAYEDLAEEMGRKL